MLEEQVAEFRLGKKIFDEMIYDYMHQDNPKYTPEIHQTRMNGLNAKEDFWIAVGMLSSIAKNTVRHPKSMYEFMIED
tara:strand:+ start:563 stop:796 length:234 start_codon:yes stop_codon:yes gene_type:complete